MTIVNNANKLSLGVQTITGLVGLYGLTLPLAPKDMVLREVLGLEMLVQGIEFVFYLVFMSILNVSTLTQFRYYDWFLSTPVMLFTISLYFFYTNFIENNDNAKPTSILEFAKNNSYQLAGILLLNFLMLLFGFLAELGLMNRGLAFVLGTASLFGSFAIIYKNYAKFSERTRNLFWIMFGLWSMYGVSFLTSPVTKNLGYTILDIFAKNFFGLFLFYNINSKTI